MYFCFPFFSRTVHGPSTLDLPNLGLVLDGTKCGNGLVCMNRKCVPLTNLDPLNCPGSSDTVCSGNGVNILLTLSPHTAILQQTTFGTILNVLF